LSKKKENYLLNNNINSEYSKRVAKRWSTAQSNPKVHWWTHPVVLKHINKIVCGKSVEGAWAGLEMRMQNLASQKMFQRGISVGCGSASKELRLLQKGIVEHFDLFEISSARIEQGISAAKKMGLSHRVKFHLQNAFDHKPQESYELVYWNNSLHHMPDAKQAILWSKDRLSSGGYFVMDDFVGPSRFQWSDKQLDIAHRVRRMLPDRFLVDPNNQYARLPITIKRPSIHKMMESDPSEAADSGNIIPRLADIFPDVEIILTGGVVYHLALNNVLANFQDEKDFYILHELLELDE
jgi:SAM-dependent methyltransferase